MDTREAFIAAVNLCEKFNKYHDIEWLEAVKWKAAAINQPQPTADMVERVARALAVHDYLDNGL